MAKNLVISKIQNGTVIDHIPAGEVFKVVRILDLTEPKGTISIAVNVDSRKYGKKDILKTEGRKLNDREINKIAIVAPNATVNTIKNAKVVKKTQVKIPNVLVDIIKCPNPACITNNEEEAKSKFYVVAEDPLVLKCAYCNTEITREEAIANFK